MPMVLPVLAHPLRARLQSSRYMDEQNGRLYILLPCSFTDLETMAARAGVEPDQSETVRRNPRSPAPPRPAPPRTQLYSSNRSGLARPVHWIYRIRTLHHRSCGEGETINGRQRHTHTTSISRTHLHHICNPPHFHRTHTPAPCPRHCIRRTPTGSSCIRSRLFGTCSSSSLRATRW